MPNPHRTTPRPRARLLRALAALAALLLAAGALAACGGSDDQDGAATSGDAASEPIRVGIFELAELELTHEIVQRATDRIREAFPDREVIVETKNAQGDTTLVQSIARDFAQSDNDIFLVEGTDAVIALANQERERPIIGLAMSDPVGAKVARSVEQPGGNVTGSIDFVPPGILFDAILSVDPAPERIGTIFNPASPNNTAWIEQARAAAEERGVEFVEATIANANDISTAARSLAGRVDAILLSPDAVVTTGTPAVASVALRNRIPLYLTNGDARDVGVLAQLGPNYDNVADVGGDVAVEVLKGADPAETAFAEPSSSALWTVNEQTLERLDVTLPPEAHASE